MAGTGGGSTGTPKELSMAEAYPGASFSIGSARRDTGDEALQPAIGQMAGQ
jgi:hypothetical protein